MCQANCGCASCAASRTSYQSDAAVDALPQGMMQKTQAFLANPSYSENRASMTLRQDHNNDVIYQALASGIENRRYNRVRDALMAILGADNDCSTPELVRLRCEDKFTRVVGCRKMALAYSNIEGAEILTPADFKVGGTIAQFLAQLELLEMIALRTDQTRSLVETTPGSGDWRWVWPAPSPDPYYMGPIVGAVFDFSVTVLDGGTYTILTQLLEWSRNISSFFGPPPGGPPTAQRNFFLRAPLSRGSTAIKLFIPFLATNNIAGAEDLPIAEPIIAQGLEVNEPPRSPLARLALTGGVTVTQATVRFIGARTSNLHDLLAMMLTGNAIYSGS